MRSSSLVLKAKAWWQSKPGAGIGGDCRAVDGQSAALPLFLRTHARILVEARPSPILGATNASCAHRIEVNVFGSGVYIAVHVCMPAPMAPWLVKLPAHHFLNLMSTLRIDIIVKIKHHQSMRTTLSLDDEVLRLVKRYAESRSLGLGKAVSELVRRGLTSQRPTRTINGLRVFDLPADSPPVTRKKIEEIELV